ncbi:MAG TPA: MBL fold metallo-hydrolase [Polyangiaceae bacterium]|jgi:L-ascorbate metabolism protein UlaG (beta-lactamase superfamily)|nr:MBL fold metallo-hydrolase [Polyangiaceae bacterium]
MAQQSSSGRFRFVNLDGSEPQGFGAVFQWAVIDRLLGRRRRGSVAAPAPRVEPDLAELQRPPAPGEPARLTWIGHASWLIQLDGVSLLVDPILFDSIGPGIRRFVPPGVPLAALPAIDATLITHNHRDHLDLASVKAVGRPLLGGLGLREFFAREQLPCTELGWWSETRIGPVTVRFVPAQHWSRRGLRDMNATLWGGFVIEGSSARIYHSGDTAYFAGFGEIGRRAGGLDAALLPIGAYDPAWFMSKQHLNPEQAVRAFSDLGARHFVAMHWGTFQLTDEPLDEPPERLKAEWQRRGLDPAACHIPAVGGTLRIAREPRL